MSHHSHIHSISLVARRHVTEQQLSRRRLVREALDARSTPPITVARRGPGYDTAHPIQPRPRTGGQDPEAA